MPQRPWPAIVMSLLATACTPTAFGWDGGLPQPLQRYRAAFAAAAGSEFVESAARADLLERLDAMPVLWLGDHHASSALHGLQFGLLDALATRCQAHGRKLVLALEAIGEGDEADVAAFLAAKLELPELQRRMRQRWPGSWLDDPTLDPWYYRALLAFGRRIGASVRALEPTPRLPLAARDRHIAARVDELVATAAGALVVVVVGQAHLLGEGDLVHRTASRGLCVGGAPPPQLLAQAPRRRTRGELHRSDGDVWWFAELLDPAN
jgi:hypothetical protein